MSKEIKLIFSLFFAGLYLVYGQEEIGTITTLIERGNHHNGSRTGVWEYYDHPSQLSLKVDYTQGKLIFIQPDTSQFYVREGDQWTKQKLAIPCRFAGSITSLIDHYDKFSIPRELLEKNIFFSAWLTFQVGPGGLASNPEVLNDPGFGFKEQLLALFNSAPNYWITGVDESENLVTCLMAIRFDFCKVCEKETIFPAKVLFTGNSPRRGGPWSTTSSSLLFSPDNRKIMVMPSILGLKTLNNNALIVDIRTKKTQQLPYDHFSSFWWIDNDNILFMPKYYSRTPAVLAKWELPNKVTFVSDSVTFGHIISSSFNKIGFMTLNEGRHILNSMDLITKNKRQVFETNTAITPELWSPNEKSILFRQHEQGIQKYTVINIESGKTVQLPVLNANICGWSQDGSTVYQLRSTKEEYRSSREKESPTQYDNIVSVRTIATTKYEPKSELIETNLLTNSTQTLFKKSKEIIVRYSPSKNMFILIMDNDAYLMKSNQDTKPVKIIENCLIAEWSNDGEFIAYISERDKQLHLYTVETNRSEYLTLQN